MVGRAEALERDLRGWFLAAKMANREEAWRTMVDVAYSRLRDEENVDPELRQSLWQSITDIRMEKCGAGLYVPPRLYRERCAEQPPPGMNRSRCRGPLEHSKMVWFPTSDVC